MKNTPKNITLTLEKYEESEFKKVLDDLLLVLAKHPRKLRKRALERLQVLTELICFEQSVTSGTVITLLLKPSQAFLDMCSAIRAGNFDFLRIEQRHSFSSVDDGLVTTVPILSTLEKLPKVRD